MKRLAICSAMSILTAHAGAQSLMRSPAAVSQPTADGQPDYNHTLRGTSMYLVEPPKPKEFKVHDLVTIVIDESSTASSKATLDTKKNYTLRSRLVDFPSVQRFLDDLELAQGQTSPIAEVEAGSNQKFKGDGTYNRSDNLRARITAEVIDVKPNGVLVLEARKSIQKDNESSTLILSGSVRREDVTNANSVLSSQLADLNVMVKNEGRVKDAAEKGIIPRILEAIFNF
ncbi:MAG: flagellar basal body L-ring protein FlgH [Planctomycetota bacterium]|nr:flagellar basal body L-ring protein FlgH [Planctomycetota bacterium]